MLLHHYNEGMQRHLLNKNGLASDRGLNGLQETFQIHFSQKPVFGYWHQPGFSQKKITFFFSVNAWTSWVGWSREGLAQVGTLQK